jgi:hypothetical protein
MLLKSVEVPKGIGMTEPTVEAEIVAQVSG